MAIVIVCPSCESRLSFDDARKGESAECPHCAEPLRVTKPVPRARPAAAPSQRADEDDYDDEYEERPLRRRLRYAAEAFDWWTGRLKGGVFPFVCPDCRTTVRLRKRRSRDRRSCPKCGFRITVDEIDKQLAELEPERKRMMNSSGCGAAVLWVLAALAVGSLSACGKRAPDVAAPVATATPEPADPRIAPPPREAPAAGEPTDPNDAEYEVLAVLTARGCQFQHPNGARESGTLHLPRDRVIRFVLSADGGNRPFEVRAFGVSAEAVADRSVTFGVRTKRAGTFGFRAGDQSGSVRVVDAGAFEALAAGARPQLVVDGSLAHTGQQLFLKLQCVNCHAAGPKAKGPTLEGLSGSRVKLTGGRYEIADDVYIAESVRNPKAKVVDGWEANMPAYDEKDVSAEELNALVAYVAALRASERPKGDPFPKPVGPPPAK